jgi:hypothetical protein
MVSDVKLDGEYVSLEGTVKASEIISNALNGSIQIGGPFCGITLRPSVSGAADNFITLRALVIQLGNKDSNNSYHGGRAFYVNEEDKLSINPFGDFKEVSIHESGLNIGNLFQISYGEFPIGNSIGGNPAPTAKGLKISSSQSDCGLILTEDRVIVKSKSTTHGMEHIPLFTDLGKMLDDHNKRLHDLDGK